MTTQCEGCYAADAIEEWTPSGSYRPRCMSCLTAEHEGIPPAIPERALTRAMPTAADFPPMGWRDAMQNPHIGNVRISRGENRPPKPPNLWARFLSWMDRHIIGGP